MLQLDKNASILWPLRRCSSASTFACLQTNLCTHSHYRGAAGVLLVYDVTCRKSFEALPKWLTHVKHYCLKGVTVLLVGNKSDLHHVRAVSSEEAEAFAEANDLVAMETSALNATGVNEAFTCLLTGECVLACICALHSFRPL